MRTVIDSSVLWAIFKQESTAQAWVNQLIHLRQESALLICEVSFAEVAPLFKTTSDFQSKLDVLGIEFEPINSETAFFAGHLFRDYRRQGGPRQNLIPDFLIGAHALRQADQLAAIDRGYLRRYFPALKIIGPDRL